MASPIVKNAKSELPHPSPSTSYILGANNGKLNPHIVRKNAPTAAAEAAYLASYESTVYA